MTDLTERLHRAKFRQSSDVIRDAEEAAIRIAKLEDALRSIVGQTDDQFVDGVWREVNTTAREALKE
ncbi:MAG: hypothetical protein ACKVKT_03110 [Rhodospirillales bacterium]